jgi:GABA(A) receptor-associated protein
MSSFQTRHPLEKRKAECARIRSKYPERYPIIVERVDSSNIGDIDKNKYLVPYDLTIGQFVYVIRKRIKLSSDQAIFLFIDNTLPALTSTIRENYEKNRNEDGFLYMRYSGESTFG